MRRARRPHIERHVAQDMVLSVVGEPDVLESHVPRHSDASATRRHDRHRRVEQLKMRSDAAIADCSRLNFSDMSLIGLKNRCEYWMKHQRPSVSVPPSTHARPTDDEGRCQRAHDLDGRVEDA